MSQFSSGETQGIEKKSLRLVMGKNPAWSDLAQDCVCFANSRGGSILIGIEDAADSPDPQQQIAIDLLDRIRKRIGELTINVDVAPHIETATNGGQYIRLNVARSLNVASTSDGRYYLRIADTCKPILGDDILRLLNERATLPWETLTSLDVPRHQIDEAKVQTFCDRIRASDRVKDSVKEKTNPELLDHYYLAEGDNLTNLGILCIGQRSDRARLGTAPVIQFLKYDEQDRKINKLVWDDYSLSPVEMVEAVWHDIPDFRERYELPDGLFRQSLPLYDESVVRELLVNALVHRPYTQRGDIFLNLFPDRLQVVNPGPLPFGVTPQNILHTTVRRNENLARIFHDLKLMEREGSGFDRMYEVLLSQGKRIPALKEGNDRVEVTIYRQVLSQAVIDLIAIADQEYQLFQREKITLGLLAQHESLNTRDLAQQLALPKTTAVSDWLGRLLELGLVKQSGHAKGTRYYVDPDILRSVAAGRRTTLRLIEPHRLRALILEDLHLHPQSSMGEIHARTAPELPRSQLRRNMKALVESGQVVHSGENRGRRYWLNNQRIDQEIDQHS